MLRREVEGPAFIWTYSSGGAVTHPTLPSHTLTEPHTTLFQQGTPERALCRAQARRGSLPRGRPCQAITTSAACLPFNQRRHHRPLPSLRRPEPYLRVFLNRAWTPSGSPAGGTPLRPHECGVINGIRARPHPTSAAPSAHQSFPSRAQRRSYARWPTGEERHRFVPTTK